MTEHCYANANLIEWIQSRTPNITAVVITYCSVANSYWAEENEIEIALRTFIELNILHCERI